MLSNPDDIQSCSSHENKVDYFKKLQHAAEHIIESSFYLTMLRSMSQAIGSEKNVNPCKTIEEGSYYLGNVYYLVQTYKECMRGAIDDENMILINSTMSKLEFNPNHISSGSSDESNGRGAKCFISKGQGTYYYKLLYSESKKDIRLFIEMVEVGIIVPVKKFLQSLIENKLQYAKMLNKPEKINPSNELTLDQFKTLKNIAEKHMHFSELYLPMLQGMSQSYGSEKNCDPWKTTKEGSYYLGNVYQLIKYYKEYTFGAIDDKNMQIINSTIMKLEFDPSHISSGFTDEAYNGKANCFVSKGQGTVYYNLLHSDSKKDVRSFIELVERDIDVPVLRFIDSLEQKLKFLSFENLFKAIEKNDRIEVEKCIKTGAVINSKNTDGQTPLHCAVNNGNITIINILLASGADPCQVTNEGYNTLHIAASRGYNEIVEVLLQHISRDKLNKFINAKSTDGNTPLHVTAASFGFLDVVKTLLKYRAIYCIKNNDRETPLDLSKNQSICHILNLTEELFKDSENGNIKMIGKLKSLKNDEFIAVTNASDIQGNTILQVTIINQHKNIQYDLLEMLKKSGQIKSCCHHEIIVEQFRKLKNAADEHINSSELYLSLLRNMSQSNSSETNCNPWKSVEQGSYYLRNAFNLVKIYKECIPGKINDENIQVINSALLKLQFNPNHIPSEFTDAGCGENVNSFNSKGQGTVYYKMLHSNSKNKIKLFVENVERDIEVPVKKFLNSIEKKFLSEILKKPDETQ